MERSPSSPWQIIVSLTWGAIIVMIVSGVVAATHPGPFGAVLVCSFAFLVLIALSAALIAIAEALDRHLSPTDEP